MKSGQMLQTLKDVLKNLPDLLRDSSVSWNTVDVTYETPHVERLWIPLGPNRLNLHRIHPCEKALSHGHPWPSAVQIISGQYEMGVAKKFFRKPQATIILTAGSSYEMVDPEGWHYVRPLVGPSLSVMLTGKPWPKDKVHRPGKGQNGPLAESAKAELLNLFRAEFPCPSMVSLSRRPVPSLHMVVAQDWEERERGWGSRPDGKTIHLTKTDCEAYCKEYAKNQDDSYKKDGGVGVPDEYSCPVGNPYNMGVNTEIYEQLKQSKNGIWV